MPEHQLILRKILLIGGGLVSVLLLLALSKSIEAEPGYLLYGAMILMAVLGFTSARWIMRAVEAVTGFRFLLSGFGLYLLFALGMMFSVFVLPLGLAMLVVQYVLARRRYVRHNVAG